MSRFVCAELKGFIPINKIINVLKHKYSDVELASGANMSLDIPRHDINSVFEITNGSNKFDMDSAFIAFTDKNDCDYPRKGLRYSYSNLIEYDRRDIELYLKTNRFEHLRRSVSNNTVISMSYCEDDRNSEIIKYICKCFGGWFYIENDVNDAVWIEKV